jgi:adhesin/invasin
VRVVALHQHGHQGGGVALVVRSSVILVLTLMGCGDDDGTMEPILVATSITLFAGNDQTVESGTAVPVRPAVIVRDQNGGPFAGTIVTFAVESGGGSATGLIDTTDSEGIARVGSWTLGAQPGGNTLLATAPGLTGDPVRFTATATEPLPGNLSVFEGDFQTAPAGSPVPIAPAVLVTGRKGPFEGAVVTFAIDSGGGSLTGAVDTTDVNGIARVGSWTLGPEPGENSLSVYAYGVDYLIQFRAFATEAPPIR